MKDFFIFIGVSILAIIFGLFCMFVLGIGCIYNTQREKHFYVGYSEKAYIHVPTDKMDEWYTIEVIAPDFKDSGKMKKPVINTDPDIITISPIEKEE